MSIIEKAANKLRSKVNVNAQQLSTEESTAKKENNTEFAYKETAPESKNNQASSPITPQTKQVSINLDELNKLGIVTPDQGKTQLAEQFRIIKRPLLTKAFSKSETIKNGNLIMIASSLAGEGKSFCALNLAMSIASEMDHRVLLVDADVARPSIPRLLGFGSQKGLLDVLLDKKLDISDVMLQTNIDKLTLVTAGEKHSHATELLAGQNMSLLLDELAQRYNDRIVIFDSPPLLLTSEARVLAARMGQIVLVVEAEQTTQHAVKEALKQIESCSSINLIYNKARAFSGKEYYGYGYGYNYS
ncbi:MAG: XrtA-associated tyrosine autokinase [Nitrosomonas sp.]|nr:XrtA-associated tyrosine autokinase [Nitrosomonas sp.]